MENKKDRKIYMDVTRILACVLVIFIHTEEMGYRRYLYAVPGSFSYIVDAFFTIFAKSSAVPLFFMISGALLLKKDEDILTVWKKRIPRIALVIVIFSLLYCFTDAYFAGESFSLSETLFGMIYSNYFHLWYLYAYLGYLITLPFLSRMVKGLDKKRALYLAAVAAIATWALPAVEFLYRSINHYLILDWVIRDIFIFPVLGYIAEEIIDIEKVGKKEMALLWGVTGLAMAGSIFLEYRWLLEAPRDPSSNFLENLGPILALSVYLTVKKVVYSKDLPRFAKAAAEISGSVFGVYLIHYWFIYDIPFFRHIWERLCGSFILGSLAGSLVASLCVFVVVCAMASVLRRIPVIRRIL